MDYALKLRVLLMVARGCYLGDIRNGLLNGTCSSDVEVEIGYGLMVKDVVACFCSTDLCNTATNLQISYLAFKAVVIHIIYSKIVT